MSDHAVPELPAWLAGLTHRDFLFDGRPIRSKRMLEQWNDLDWSRAWMDMGPSPAGNTGPYWKVPLRSGETVHRLYPKLIHSKWSELVRHAINEAARDAGARVQKTH